MSPWYRNFNERQIHEIEFCLDYAANFAHGTDGHNTKMIIARMAGMLHKIHRVLDSGETSKVIPEIEEVMGYKEEE